MEKLIEPLQKLGGIVVAKPVQAKKWEIEEEDGEEARAPHGDENDFDFYNEFDDDFDDDDLYWFHCLLKHLNC